MASSRSNVGTRWYAGGLRFECSRCGGCCGGEPGDVFVTRDEIERIAARLGRTIDEFSAECLRYTSRGASLVERENGDCVLLSEPGDGHRRCTVYEERPVQCRRWPFWAENLASPRDWRRAAETCPGMDAGRLYAPDEIDDLRL